MKSILTTILIITCAIGVNAQVDSTTPKHKPFISFNAGRVEYDDMGQNFRYENEFGYQFSRFFASSVVFGFEYGNGKKVYTFNGSAIGADFNLFVVPTGHSHTYMLKLGGGLGYQSQKYERRIWTTTEFVFVQGPTVNFIVENSYNITPRINLGLKVNYRVFDVDATYMALAKLQYTI